MRLACACLIAATCLALPTTSRADTVVVLPMHTARGVPAQLSERAFAAVVQRLNDSGFTTMLPVEDPDGVSLNLRDCDSPSCSETTLFALQADFGIDLAVSPRVRGDRELFAMVLLPTSEAVSISITFQDDVDAAAVELVQRVVTAWRRFTPSESPHSAQDDEPVGGASRDGAAGVAPRSERRVSGWNYVLGGAMVLGGAALLVPSGIAWARDGQCVASDQQGRCRDDGGSYERYQFGTTSKIMMGAGAALTVGGIVVVAARPIRVSATVDGTSYRLHIRGEF